MSDPDSILTRLMATIEDRRRNRPRHSYTTQLIEGGVDAVGAKVLEEAIETVEAARQPEADRRRARLVKEAADLIYHLLVLLAVGDVTLADVEAELARRFGVSGLDEKAARDG